MKVKTILVSQPQPKTDSSPYFDLMEKQKVKVDFRSFIHVEGASSKDVRTQKIDLSKYTAIIFTSRNSVDHFFRIAEELRFKTSDSLKYFCTSEAVAYYLQKYVVYRKRKIYVGERHFQDLMPLIKKHKDETEGHIERLQQVFELIGKRAQGKTCDAIEGIISEGEEIIENFKGTPALDAGLISAAQAVEHYEITRYGTLKRWAEVLGMSEAAKLFKQTLDEESMTDEALTTLADASVNETALAAV